MTAAVPGPRFRDQLAEVPTREDRAVAAGLVRRARAAMSDDERDAVVDAVAREIASERAAEVEARVQAAANQRAAEIVTRVKAIPTYTLTNDDKPLGTVVLADDVLAALASPAPAPRAEEGQR